jgi:hypothetical protein
MIDASPEAVMAKLRTVINEPERSISTIYLSYVRPFGELTDSFASLLLPDIELRSHPPTVAKVRMFLYQLMVQLEIFARERVDDPLSPEKYAIVLDLVRSISPLAGAIGGDLLSSFLRDLRVVHAQRWPRTLAQIESDVGFSSTPALTNPRPPPERRTHYRESVTLSARPPFQTNSLDRTFRVRIKKTTHGPSSSTIRPLLISKPPITSPPQ